DGVRPGKAQAADAAATDGPTDGDHEAIGGGVPRPATKIRGRDVTTEYTENTEERQNIRLGFLSFFRVFRVFRGDISFTTAGRGRTPAGWPPSPRCRPTAGSGRRRCPGGASRLGCRSGATSPTGSCRSCA